MTIYEKLLNIQNDIICNKSQFNKFGNYNYRSCEDILEAVKPKLKENKCLLFLTDELVNIGERYYIKAQARLIDAEDGHSIIVDAYAREEETKKGMDGSQVTGASSSYARKYALNGLFCIDDQKDSDATNKHGKDTEEKPLEGYGGDMANITQFEKGTITPAQLKIIGAFNETQKKWVLKTYKVKSIDDLTTEQASAIIKQKEAKEAQKEAQKEAVAQ